MEIFVITLFILYIIIELIFILIIKYLHAKIPWIITEKDEYPEFNKIKIKTFFEKTFDLYLGWNWKAKSKHQEKIFSKLNRINFGKFGERKSSFQKKGDYSFASFGDSFVFCRYVKNNETWQDQLAKPTSYNGIERLKAENSWLSLKVNKNLIIQIFRLSGIYSNERNILTKFTYVSNEAFLHTDNNLMPLKKNAWSSWNSITKKDKTCVTYWLNNLQNLETNINYFLTLNPVEEIDNDKIIKKVKLQKKLHLIQGKRRTWFTGSYFGYGFHEDGLKSSIKLLENFNI